MPITVIPRTQTGVGAFTKAFNPYLQMMMQEKMRERRTEKARMGDLEAEGRLEPATAETPGAVEWKGNYYTIKPSPQERLVGLKEEESERELMAQAFKLTKERRDVPGVGRAYIHPEDVKQNYQMLKDLMDTADADENDLQTFIDSEEERNVLKKSNPAVYSLFLKKAQAQGKLMDIEVITPEVEEPEVEEPREPLFKLPPTPPPTLPPEAPGAARVGEKFGQLGRVGFERAKAFIPERIKEAVFPVMGAGPSVANIGLGAARGLTGLPVPTVPEEYSGMIGRGQAPQAIGAYYSDLLKRIKERYGF